MKIFQKKKSVSKIFKNLTKIFNQNICNKITFLKTLKINKNYKKINNK